MQACPVPEKVREAALRTAKFRGRARIFYWRRGHSWFWSHDRSGMDEKHEPCWVDVVHQDRNRHYRPFGIDYWLLPAPKRRWWTRLVSCIIWRFWERRRLIRALKKACNAMPFRLPVSLDDTTFPLE